MDRKKNQFSAFNFKTSIILIGCFFIVLSSKAQYQLRFQYADKDSAFNVQSLKLQTNFPNREACIEYVSKLPSQLNIEGYASASVDSMHYDSTFATVLLYHGRQQHWIDLHPGITATDIEFL
jgi:hypothetical protein